MSPVTGVQHKHFRLNHLKIKRVQKLLQTGTETETIERALDLVLDEHERNQAAERANQRFLSSRIEIERRLREDDLRGNGLVAPVLFDTSVYISALRKGDSARLALRNFAPGSAIWLSSVVLEELYAGADTKAARVVQRLERDFDRARRILVPTLSDWTATGKTLAHLAVKYHYEQIGQGRLTNDALIAMSAARMGVTVITANPRDFQKLAEFRAFSWKVAVV